MSTNKVNTTLTEECIHDAPDSEYMNDEQLAFFKKKLLNLRETINLRTQEAKNQMIKPQNDLSDPNDRASWEEQSSVAFRIAKREQNLLPKIQQSLERIRSGVYGYCIDTNEPIGIPRLLARPTAEYCAEAQRIKELKEIQYR